MAFDTSIPQGFRPTYPEPQINALARVMQVQGMQQQNALARAQYEDVHAQRQMQMRQAELDRQYRASIQAPRGPATPGVPAMNAAQAEAAMKSQGYGQSSASEQPGEVDPKMEAFASAARAGAIPIAEFLKQAYPDRKVVRLLKVEGKDGRPYTIGLDDQNKRVGEAMPDPVEPKMVNQGDRQSFVDPYAARGQSLPVFQDANSKASNATTLRGQNMVDARTRESTAMTDARSRELASLTDARARDFNSTLVRGNEIKANEAAATRDLTKQSQIASFDTMLGTLDRLSQHPGLTNSVGIRGALPTMPGSNSANFQAELNTFQSQAFLPMVAQLKGMGALSDAEGKKLTAAVGALDPKMGETAFRESVSRITSDMTAARERMAGKPRPATKSPATGAPKPGDVVDGYVFKGGKPSDSANWVRK